MTDRSTSLLDDYLLAVRQRLERMHLLRAAGAIALVSLLLTLAGVLVAIRTGFSPAVVNLTRAALVLAAGALLFWLLLRPWRRLRDRPAGDVEALTPEFQGRVEAFLGMRERGNPLQELLAEDTLAVARRHEPAERIPRWQLIAPGGVAAVSILVLLWLGIAGPGLFGYGVRHVWAGWAVDGLLPEQGILVTPGNHAVRRGGSVPVLATMRGFDPSAASIHARIGAGAWQAVDMTRSPRGFEFTLLSVREPVSYYITAGDVRSAQYAVNVVEVPEVENLKLVYNYPQWTRRKPRTDDPGGDVSAVAGTDVKLTVKTDRPIGDGLLVINGKDATLDASGNLASGQFKVGEEGRYYIAARVGSETVRLTDDYLIQVVPDAKPEIRIVKPGRDASASSIEEVTARIEATDDFALENVELRYAINGGTWQSVPIRAGGERVDAARVLMLEELRAAAEDRPLAAGDLIAYYATARDRAQSAQTDMYFVEVRPFDRRYTQSQEQGGGGGGGGGGEQSEISRRQKEILISTWNLIRQRNDQQAARAAAVRDNARLLADVQEKLAAQAETLATRAQSRELTEQDEQIRAFIQHMKDAAKAMQPAAERLAAVNLEQAIQPEQLALQHLLRAEAVFNDMTVSMQRNAGGGGGGGQSSRDLAQLYELEMDLEKNQYESGSSASPEESGEQMDELGRKLQELARRQEQLANEARRQQQLTDEQRWQQESLRREAEQLQRQLQQLSQQAANGQNAQGSQGSQGGQGQQGQQGQQGGAGGAGGQIAQQLQQAISAMNRASEAMRNGSDDAERQQQLQRAANEASRQLGGASRQLSQQRQQAIAGELNNLVRQADDLYARQSEVEQELQESASAAARTPNRTDTSAGLSTSQRRDIAERKRELGSGVQRIEQQLAEAARRMRGEAPGTADSLQEAGQMLAVNQVQNLLTVGAQYVERGLGAYVVPREGGITETLREVRDELRSAQSQSSGPTQGQRNDRALQDALAQVQSLREQVQQMANANAANAQGSQGSQGQSASGQQGREGSQQGGNATGGAAGDLGGLRRALANAGRQVGGLAPVLAGGGGDARSAESVRELARQLQAANLNGTGDVLNQQLASSLTVLEQLELRLSRGAKGGSRGTVRTAIAEPVAEQYRDAVAEYYRQLSED